MKVFARLILAVLVMTVSQAAFAQQTSIAGLVTTLAGSIHGTFDGIGAAASFSVSCGVAADGTNLYVADSLANEIRKIEIRTGAVTTLAGSPTSGFSDGIGAAARFNTPTFMATDGENLFVADALNRSIRKIVIATGAVSTLAGSGKENHQDGKGSAAGFDRPSGMAVAGPDLYVADRLWIRKVAIATGAVTTVAGSGKSGHSDGTGIAASFFGVPGGMASDGKNLYVLDNGLIRKIAIETGLVATVKLAIGDADKNGASGISAKDILSPTGSLYSFSNNGLTTDGTNLYVTEKNRVLKIVIGSGVVSVIAGSTKFGHEDGAGAAAGFYGPLGVAIAGNELYVADADLIRGVAVDTGLVTTLAGSIGNRYKNGTGSSASFDAPCAVATDGTSVYVSEANYLPDSFAICDIRRIDIASGAVTTLAGSDRFGHEDGTGKAASFGIYIKGLATDGNSLYVSDSNYNLIRKIVIGSGAVTTFAGSGKAGHQDGSGPSASFNHPAGLATDGTNLYVADSANDEIRKIAIATGLVSTFAGSVAGGSANGIGSAAGFNQPSGIVLDEKSLYVTDSGNNEIRKIDIATGAVTTLAGSLAKGSADGTGTAARFDRPLGAAIDGKDLYVSESRKIRKIDIDTGAVTTLAGSDEAGFSDGAGKTASFWQPNGLAMSSKSPRRLFVADSSSNLIREIR
jgi:hypothetical protein